MMPDKKSDLVVTLLRRMMIDGMSVQAIAEAGSTHKLRVSGAIELVLEQLVEILDGMPGRLWVKGGFHR